MTNEVPNDRRRGLSPPQFGLATLLLVVAILCVVLAVLTTLGPYGVIAVILLLLAIAGHVAGNTIGNRLRDNGSRPLDDEGRPLPAGPVRRPRADRCEFAPKTRLSERHSLGLPIVIAPLMGVVAGAAAGGYWFVTSMWEHATPLNVIMAALAFGALGGIWAFLAAGFFQVAISALWQATREAKRH